MDFSIFFFPENLFWRRLRGILPHTKIGQPTPRTSPLHLARQIDALAPASIRRFFRKWCFFGCFRGGTGLKIAADSSAKYLKKWFSGMEVFRVRVPDLRLRATAPCRRTPKKANTSARAHTHTPTHTQTHMCTHACTHGTPRQTQVHGLVGAGATQ